MTRIVWLGMLSVMAGLAPAVEKPAAQDNETAVVPKPGTKAFYELRIVGRCALDGDCLVPITTTEPVSSAISRTLPPGLTRLGMTTGRPLSPGLTRLGGVRNHAKWIEGHAIQSLGTNRVVIGQAETNASGVVFHRPSCVVDLLPETPVSEVGTDIRVLAVPDDSVSCTATTTDRNNTLRRTLQVYREVRQPTFEEYKAIYERESRPVPLEPIVSLEREPPGGFKRTTLRSSTPSKPSQAVAPPFPSVTNATPLPAVGTLPAPRKTGLVSGPPATPASDAPFVVLVTNDTVRIVKYTGTDAKVAIPERIDGLPVVAIQAGAFDGCHGITAVTIPATVTSIHDHAFHGCPALTSILVDVMNPVYSSSADGVLFNMEKTRLVRFPMGKQGEYTVPQRTTEIGSHAFEECPGLTEITLPERLEEIGCRAFWGCSSLKTILFKGDAPKAADRSVFQGCSQATVYRRSGAKGWGETFGGRPVKLRDDADFGSTGKTNALAPRISNTPTSVDVKTEETGTFRATLTDFNPPSPSILGHGDRVEYMIHYEIDAEGEYYIFTRPMFKGNPAPNYGSHPSGRYRRGTGELDGFWDFYKDAKVDQIKISFHKREDGSDRRDRREIVKEMYVDVDYEFRDKYADVKPNPLYDGIRISANMSLQNAARLRDAFSKDGAKRVDSHDCGASARATSIGADVGIKTVQRALELCRQHMPDAKRFYIFSEDRYRKTINFGSGRSPNIPDMPPDLFSKLLAPDLTLEEFHRLVNDHNATATSVASPPAPVRRRRPPAPVRPSATLKVGDPAPPLAQGKYVQGEPVAAFEKGKVYVVEFWATWCGPCRTVIPHVNALQEKYKDKGLVVIGQNVWQRGENVEGDVAEFVKQMGSNMTYRVALDRDDAMSGIWMKAAGRGGIPSAFVVDREGKIAWIGHPGSGLDDAVGTLLGNIGQGARP